MDGWVIIGTELDTKQLEQDLKNAKRELSSFQKEEEKLLKEKGKIELNLSGYEEEKAKIKANTDELLTKAETESQVTNLLNMENLELDNLNQKYSKQFSSLEEINTKLKENQTNQGLVNKKIDEANAKLNQSKGLENIKQNISNVNDKLSSTVRTVARWALAIFSVRSAYSLLSQASSTLGQYDAQYAANLEYIRYVLAQAIAPVLQYLVNLAYKLLSYINYIANAWFGINLFGKASAKNFQSMKNSASGTAKAAKEIQKSLAGFDEMNVLSDTSTSSGGTSGGATAPSFDLSQLQGEVPSWIKWIAENKDIVIAGLAGIAAGLIALQLGASGLMSLGIGIAIAGIVYIIESLISYLNDPSWTNFGKIIQGIGVVIVGVGVAIGSIPAIVIGAAVLILGTIIKYWEQIKSFFQSIIDWLTDKSDWVHNMFGDTIGNIYDTTVANLQLLLNWFDSIFKSIKGIFDGLITFIKGVFTGNWKQAWEGIKTIFVNIWNAIKATFTYIIGTIKNSVVNIAQTTGNIIASVFKAVVNAVLRTIEYILNNPIRAVNALISAVNTLPRSKLK